MEELSLNGDLVREIVLKRICLQSRKDESERRKSFIVTKRFTK